MNARLRWALALVVLGITALVMLRPDAAPAEASRESIPATPLTPAMQRAKEPARVQTPVEDGSGAAARQGEDPATPTVEVRLMAGATGKPIPNAPVHFGLEAVVIRDPAYNPDPVGTCLRSLPQRTTDSRGIVRIPLRDGVLVAAAVLPSGLGHSGDDLATTHGGLLRLEPEDGIAGPYELVLRPETSRVLRAVDPQGQPVAGVRVIWRPRWTRDPSAPAGKPPKTRNQRIGTTGPDGTIRWRDLETDVAAAEERDGTGPCDRITGMEILADIVGVQGDPVVVEGMPAPEASIDVPVGAHGGFQVTLLDHNDQAMRGQHQVIVFNLGKPRTHLWSPATVTLDATVVIPGVALGQVMTATTMGGPKLKTPGPQVVGEIAVGQLRPGKDHMVIRARLVDAHGDPMQHAGSVRLTAHYNDGLSDSSNLFGIGDSGVIDFYLKVRPGKTVRNLGFELEGDRRERRAVRINRPMAGTTHELGDLGPGMRGLPLLAAGRVQLDATARCDDLHMQVEVQHPERGWIRPNGTFWNRQADGRFTVHGIPAESWARDIPRKEVFPELPGAPLRLHISSKSRCHIPVQPIRFTPGTRDLQIRLDRGAHLDCLAQIPAGIRAAATVTHALDLVLVPTTANTVPATDVAGIAPTADGPPVDGRLSLGWDGLVPGEYRLEVRSAIGPWGTGPLHHTIPGLRPGSTTAESPLALDLTDMLRPYTLTAVDAGSGDPLLVRLQMDPEDRNLMPNRDGTWQRAEVSGYRYRGYLGPAPMPILLTETNHESLALYLEGGEHEIALQPRFERPLLVRVSGLGTLPGDIRPSLMWAPKELGDGDLLGYAGWALRRVGAAGLDLLESDHSVQLSLRRKQPHRLTLRLFGNPPVDAPNAPDTVWLKDLPRAEVPWPPPAEWTLTVPPEALRGALQKMGR